MWLSRFGLVFETDSLSIAGSDHETPFVDQAANSKRSFCLLSAEIKGMYHSTWQCVFDYEMKSHYSVNDVILNVILFKLEKRLKLYFSAHLNIY